MKPRYWLVDTLYQLRDTFLDPLAAHLINKESDRLEAWLRLRIDKSHAERVAKKPHSYQWPKFEPRAHKAAKRAAEVQAKLLAAQRREFMRDIQNIHSLDSTYEQMAL